MAHERNGIIIFYKQANETELEFLWDQNIRNHPGDIRWIHWKKDFIKNNRSGRSVTFLVLCKDTAVGEGTLLLSPECTAIAGRDALCNGTNIANINALRIQKKHEGKGHISKLIREMERFAVRNGISMLTIGVESKETRTLAIYLHLGFTEFLCSAVEDGALVLYFGKRINSSSFSD